jgi:Family of unknown function (DUF6152)
VYKWAHWQAQTEIPAETRKPFPRRRGRRFLRSKFLMIFALGVEVSIFSASLFAHHGYAAYDTEKKITLKGTVTSWLWANPHCVLGLDVTDESGQVVHWGAETENPSTMTRQGWTMQSVKPGDQITLTVIRVKNGKPIGRIVEIVLANGQRLQGRVNPATQVKPEESPKE